MAENRILEQLELLLLSEACIDLYAPTGFDGKSSVRCIAAWTEGESVRFIGDTLEEALAQAVAEMGEFIEHPATTDAEGRG